MSVVLEQTVLAEAAFVQLLAKLRANLTVTNYRLDNPDCISMEQRLDPQQIKPVQDQLLTIIQSADSTHESNMQREVVYEKRYSRQNWLANMF